MSTRFPNTAPRNPAMEVALRHALSTQGMKKKCEHEYKKTLAKNGMSFILMCHKCLDSKPYIEPMECENES